MCRFNNMQRFVCSDYYLCQVSWWMCVSVFISLWLCREDIWMSTGMKKTWSLLKTACNQIWELIMKDDRRQWWIDIGWAGVLLEKQTACLLKPSFFMVGWKRFLVWLGFFSMKVGLWGWSIATGVKNDVPKFCEAAKQILVYKSKETLNLRLKLIL